MTRKDIMKERFDELLNDCQKTIFESIIGPFGLAKILFEDKIGGNVNTVHNVRNDIYATKEEHIKYETREKYDDNISKKYHSDSNYVKKNHENSILKENGNLYDSYTGEKIKINDKSDLDHTISASEIHEDQGRILAELDGIQLANTSSNLNATSDSTNRSKKHKTMEKFAKELDKKSPERKKRIKELSTKTELSDKERKELNKLNKLDKFNKEKAMELDKKSRSAYEKKINSTYYKSKKFQTDTLKTAGNDALKMGIQQAIGLLLYESTKAIYDEFKSIVNAGVEIKEDFFESFKARINRIISKIKSKLIPVLKSFKDGALSGFLSSLITTLVNAFFTTGKNMVKIIREGFLGIIKALKFMMFPPPEMSKEEAIKQGLKILSTSVFVGVGIIIEESLKTLILGFPMLVPYSSIITSVSLGIIIGILSSISSYIIDTVFLNLNMPKNLETFEELEKNLTLQNDVLNKLENLSLLSINIKEKYIQFENNTMNISKIYKNILVYEEVQSEKMKSYIVSDKENIKLLKKKYATTIGGLI